MTFATTRTTIAKAILDGLVFELRMNTDLLQATKIQIEALHAVGGGARSPLWLQLKADICQIPLRVPRITEAACQGAALLAGVGADAYPDLETVVEQVVRFERRVDPREEDAAQAIPRPVKQPGGL